MGIDADEPGSVGVSSLMHGRCFYCGGGYTAGLDNVIDHKDDCLEHSRNTWFRGTKLYPCAQCREYTAQRPTKERWDWLRCPRCGGENEWTILKGKHRYRIAPFSQ